MCIRDRPMGMDKEAYLARWEELNEVVHAIAMRYDCLLYTSRCV